MIDRTGSQPERAGATIFIVLLQRAIWFLNFNEFNTLAKFTSI